jgi:ribonuclease-3
MPCSERAEYFADIFLEDGNSQLQHYACNKEMAHQAKRTHIDKFIRPGPLHPCGALQSTHGLATDIEAIVGAVWIDSERNFEAVQGVMRRLNIYPNQI